MQKRVYELLCMYKNMQNKTFKRDLIELKTMLGIIDPKRERIATLIGRNFKQEY